MSNELTCLNCQREICGSNTKTFVVGFPILFLMLSILILAYNIGPNLILMAYVSFFALVVTPALISVLTFIEIYRHV